MLRTALKPRWLGLLAIVTVVMVTFGTLGLWQLNVARDKAKSEQVRTAPVRAVADIAAVLTPHGSFPSAGTGRRITATGRYDATGQLLVTSRRLGGKPGYWVVTPLVVQSTGARIAVVRGFVTEPGQATSRVGAQPVSVSGTLASSESATTASSGSDPADAVLPDGQLASLDLSLLVNRWPGALYNAFIFATAERPDVTSFASPAVQRVPPPALVDSGLSWRNAAYAFQWWVFAFFALYMWWRMVRDDYEDSRMEQVQPQHQAPRALADPGLTGKARNV